MNKFVEKRKSPRKKIEKEVDIRVNQTVIKAFLDNLSADGCLFKIWKSITEFPDLSIGDSIEFDFAFSTGLLELNGHIIRLIDENNSFKIAILFQ